jgi:hypothetical protein
MTARKINFKFFEERSCVHESEGSSIRDGSGTGNLVRFFLLRRLGQESLVSTVERPSHGLFALWGS